MKIHILLGLLLSQSSLANLANPEWNSKPKLEQQLTKALDVSSYISCTAGKQNSNIYNHLIKLAKQIHTSIYIGEKNEKI